MSRTTLALWTIAAISPFALAQNCGLRNSARIAHSLCESGAGNETIIDTGIVTAGPLLTTQGVNPSNACGCHSSINVVISSDYGSLSYTATASGQSCGCCGIFMWIDQGPGDAKARFFDRLTIQSSTLPAGTPVTIRASITLVGGVNASNLDTERSFGGQLDVLGPISRNLFVTDTQGTTSDQFTLGVGTSVDINARLFSILRDRALQGLNQTGSFGANINATVSFEVLTPGATLVSCSGHDYTPQIPCAADLDNGSGTGTPDNAVDVNDLLFFLSAFEAGSIAVDLDDGSGTGTHDNAVDINDLLYFLVRFEAGC